MFFFSSFEWNCLKTLWLSHIYHIFLSIFFNLNILCCHYYCIQSRWWGGRVNNHMEWLLNKPIAKGRVRQREKESEQVYWISYTYTRTNMESVISLIYFCWLQFRVCCILHLSVFSVAVHHSQVYVSHFCHRHMKLMGIKFSIVWCEFYFIDICLSVTRYRW